ncbi:hypothetical protein RB595_007193 [Gaeumannomyces hyphopodioides]
MLPSSLPPITRTMSEPSVRTQTLRERHDDAQSTTTTLATSSEDATISAAAAAPLSPGLTPLESPHPGRSVSYSNRPLSGSGARASRFIETPMFEYTPANSIYEEDISGASRSESQERRASIFRLVLRITNCVSHLAVVVMLLAIMSSFLATSSMWYRTMSPEAVVLVIVLSLDALFDLRALALCRTPWPGWALVARLVLGLAYLTTFMVYIGVGGTVFPHNFSYWGMAPGYGAPLVFLLMWLLGVWNLVHAAIHRYSFGSALGACLGLAKPNSASAPTPAPAMAMAADRRRDDAAGSGGGGGGGIMAAVRGLGIRRGAAPGDDDDVEAGRWPASSRAGTVAPMMAQSSDMDLSTLNGRPSRSHDDKTMDSTSTLGRVRPPTANRTG